MKYNEYDKTNPIRFYIHGVEKKTYVSRTSKGDLVVSSPDKTTESQLKSGLLHLLGKESQLSMKEITDALDALPNIGAATKSKPKRSKDPLSNVVIQKVPSYFKDYSQLKNTKSPAALDAEANELDTSTIKFKAISAKSISIILDHREPDALFDMLERSQIASVDIGQLPLADILATDGKSEIYFERKTVTDLHASTVGDEKRVHSQVERYYAFQQAKAKEGISVKFIWIIEGEDGASRGLYHSLQNIKNVDGLINYWVGISDQYVVSTFNLAHTAYLALKIIQGHFERLLTYPVKINGVRIDKKHEKTSVIASDNDGERGVTRSTDNLAALLSYFPYIRSNVAKELANTGRSLSEITLMSIPELEKIKGVSKASAPKIHASLNMRQK